MIKDYYKILEVPATATGQEIKKSFRRLAQRYHPDKHAGSHMADAHFREIQEAYKVLSDPKEREAYNYKRWHIRSTGQPFAKAALTPTAILQECKVLQQYVASMNVFHVSYDAVSHHIRQLLTGNAIGILHEHNDAAINRNIIQLLLQAAQPLPQKYFTPITRLLLQVAGDDSTAHSTIQQALLQKKQRHAWDRYKWVLMLVITALICWLMYWYGK
jgi:molecular chaperone DnaJ